MAKVLIANRGEIAVRVIRSLRELGIRSVAVYSTGDRDSLHVSLADEAYAIGDAPSVDSYLDIEKIINAAKHSKSTAIHPGYGFLAESHEFAKRVEEEGLIFIGPSWETIKSLGDKSQAKARVSDLGLPVIPGSDGPLKDYSQARKIAEEIGYPVLIKAVSGGGGRGMRIVENEYDLKKNFQQAKQEAASAFNDSRLYMEKFIPRARHIEVQVLGDGNGGAVHLYERDCSIQRKHQKLIEEAPALAINEETRTYITELTAQVVSGLKYAGAGTIEFLYVENDNQFYFMEMNTRIQVEHTISEEITGIDIIKQQIYVALYNELTISQKDVGRNGFALEVRINAEDSSRNFMPTPGKIDRLHFGLGRNIRVDTHVYAGYEVPRFYDSMIAKIIVTADNRENAIDRMKRVLDETVIEPIATNLDFQRYIMAHPKYRANQLDIHFLEDNKLID